MRDFEQSEVLILNFAAHEERPNILWRAPDLFEKKYTGIFEVAYKLTIKVNYDPKNSSGKGYLFQPGYTAGWTMNLIARQQFDSEKSKPKPTKSLTLEQLTHKPRWWKFW